MADGCRLVLGPRCRVMGAQPEVVLALEVARGAAESVGVRILTVSHLTDGQHKVDSLHYLGFAADLTISNGDYQAASDAIRGGLPQDYDVVNEGTHVHVEHQLKRPINA